MNNYERLLRALVEIAKPGEEMIVLTRELGSGRKAARHIASAALDDVGHPTPIVAASAAVETE